MTGGPVQFAPGGGGGIAAKPLKFGNGGYANSLDLYTSGSTKRLIVMENYGYGVYDASNPAAPVVIGYSDMSVTVPQQGDGQSIIVSLAAGADGSRALVNWKQSPHGTFLMKVRPDNTFDFGGDFSTGRAPGGVVADQVGNRYLGYALPLNGLYVADITAFQSGNAAISSGSIPSEIAVSYPAGTSTNGLHRAGHFLVYTIGKSAVVVDVSNPGPPGAIASGFDFYQIPNVAFGLASTDQIVAVDAAIHPVNGKLYVMAVGAVSSRPTGIGVVSTGLASVNFTAVGSPFRPPAPYNNVTGLATTAVAAIATGDDVYFQSILGSGTVYKLFTLSANGWGSDISPTVTVDQNTSTYFNSPQIMRGFASAGKVYSYVAAQGGAYALPLACTASNSPAVPDLQVDIDNGNGTFTPLASGGTAFIGDKLRISSAISPNPASVPLSGWALDYDFHASEDNGGSFPRIKTPDLSSPNGAPPSPLTLVGPCDPQIGGTDPSTGSGCWSSVLSNSATGGPDFTGTPAAGSQKLLAITLEAENTFGSGFKSFGVNWKVPAAKLKSTSVLLGGALQSGSEGHPAATGYKWYFGTQTNAPAGELLTQDTSCTGPTCTHAFPAKGVYNYWLTTPYPNGFTTADCQDPCTSALGAVSVTDVVLGFDVPGTILLGSPTVPITNQSTVAGSVTPCGSGYEYTLCDASSGSCAEGAYSSLSFGGVSGSVPAPSAAGVYWLRLRYNYSTTGIGGCGAPLSAQWQPGVTSDAAAWPFAVANVVPTIKVLVNNQDPCPPGPGGSGCGSAIQANVNDTLTCYAYVNGARDDNPPSGLAWTFGANSSPSSGAGQGAQTHYTKVGTSTITMTGYGGAITQDIEVSTAPVQVTHLSLSSISATPNPVAPGTSVSFRANYSNASGSLTYRWDFGDGGTSTSATPSHSYLSAANYTARVTLSDPDDTVTGSTTVYVQSTQPAPNPIDFTVNDTNTGGRVLYQPCCGFSVTSGQNLTFVSINATGGISWNFGDGTTGSGGTVLHTYNVAQDTIYRVTLTANSQTKQYSVEVSGTGGSLTASYTSSTYFDGAPVTAGNVTGGKAIHFVAADDADTYDWDFGDQSAHGSGKTVDHAFVTAGSFTVKLTVTKSGVGTATTQSPRTFTVPTPPAPTLWLLGGMAYTDGLGGTFWQSDLSIFNPDPTRGMLVSVAFLSGQSNIGSASELQWQQVVIDKQSTKSFKNVLSNVPFALQKGSFGAILIRGDDIPTAPIITGRTFNSGGAGGTYGLSIPAVPVTGGVRTQASSAGNVLIGLREQPGEFHTNFALANLAGDFAKAQVQFVDAQGLQLGQAIPLDLAPYGVHQINRALSSAPADGGAGYTQVPAGSFAAVVSLVAGTSVFPYATVINEHTGDPIVITPPTRPSVSYRLPGIVRSHGKNNTLFKSDITIYNSSVNTRDVNIRFWYQASRDGKTSGVQTYAARLTLKGRESLDFADFVKGWLPPGTDVDTTDYANSYVDITPADGNTEPLLVLGHTYNDQPGGSVGFQVPGYTTEDGVIGTGANKRLTMTGLSSGSGYRTNVALFLNKQDAINVAAGATIKVIDTAGNVLRSIPVGLSDAVSSFTQVNDDTLFGGLTGDVSTMTVVVDGVSGTAPIAGYATVIDNFSGDAILVPGQPTP